MDYIKNLYHAPHAVAALSAVEGLVSHQYFRVYEPTITGFLTCFVALQTGNIVSFRIFLSTTQADFLSLALLSAISSIVYLFVLGSSILAYRIFLHPLRRYPGPLLSRITRWEWFFRARSGLAFYRIHDLHEKYGDIVRVGPNDLAFRNPKDTPIINGPGSKLSKGPAAEGSPWAKANSVTFIRDRNEHRFRRRIWDQGFSTSALRTYEPRIQILLNQLSEQFAARNAKVVDIAEWTAYFAFDAMGELGFGADFGMIRTGKFHMYSNYIRHALKMRRSWMQVPWCKYATAYLPTDKETKKQTQQFLKFGDDRLEARKREGTTRTDIISHLLAQDKESGGRLTELELKEEARAIIIAGSDTTSFALTAIMFFLMENPHCYEKLQQEIDKLNIVPGTLATNIGFEQAPYINAVIHESLRLLPPAPENTQRTLGNNSFFVNGQYIPPGTKCYVSVYSMARDDRFFTDAKTFLPERWIKGALPKHYKLDTNATVPFGSGLYNCAGRPLAMLEMRQFLLVMLYRFHFEKGPGFNEKQFLQSLHSFGTMNCCQLPLTVFTRAT